MTWALLSLATFGGASAAQAPETPTIRPDVASTSDNIALQAIVDADQADRLGDAITREPEKVFERDATRRSQTLSIIRSRGLRSARDYFNAALVMQHSPPDIELAYALATLSHYLDPENKAPTSLMAAAWDRLLMQRVQPQWYGTQYQNDGAGVFLFPVAEGVITDIERARLGVPTLGESRARVAEMAQSVGAKPLPTPLIGMLQAKARAEAAASEEK